MTVMVTLEHRFFRTPDGAVWSQTMFAYPFWTRYLEVFDGVRVVARVLDVAEVPPDWQRADGPNVSFGAVPYYLGPAQYLVRARQVTHAVRHALAPDMAVIMRVGSRLGAASLLIPRGLWPSRPPTKAKEGTEVQYCRGTRSPDTWQSARASGLAGGTMMNFSPLAVPVAFFGLGRLVLYVRRGFLWPAEDPRRLLLPLLVSLCVVALTGDSDNVIFLLVKTGAAPLPCSGSHPGRLRSP